MLFVLKHKVCTDCRRHSVIEFKRALKADLGAATGRSLFDCPNKWASQGRPQTGPRPLSAGPRAMPDQGMSAPKRYYPLGRTLLEGMGLARSIRTGDGAGQDRTRPFTRPADLWMAKIACNGACVYPVLSTPRVAACWPLWAHSFTHLSDHSLLVNPCPLIYLIFPLDLPSRVMHVVLSLLYPSKIGWKYLVFWISS